jgi:hypothetical protein
MKRHPFDPLSLAFGLVFAIGGLAFAFGGATVGDLDNDLLWSVVILGAGLLFLIPAISRTRTGSQTEADEQPAPADSDQSE